jgi:hypothetical protein
MNEPKRNLAYWFVRAVATPKWAWVIIAAIIGYSAGWIFEWLWLLLVFLFGGAA